MEKREGEREKRERERKRLKYYDNIIINIIVTINLCLHLLMWIAQMWMVHCG